MADIVPAEGTTATAAARKDTASLGALMGNGARLLGGQGALVAVSFLQAMLATRTLGPDRFGAWALINSFSTLAGLFLSFRTSEAFTSFWVETDAEGAHAARSALFSAAFYAEAVTKGAAFVVVLGFGPLIMHASDVWSSLSGVVVCAAFTLFLTAVDPLWFSLMRHRRRITALAATPVAIAALRLAASGALILAQGPSVLSLAEAYLVTQLVSTLVKVNDIEGLYGPLLGPRGLLRSPLASVRGMRRQGAFWRMMSAGYVSSCLSSVVKEADGLAIGLLAGAREVGFYRLAKSLTGLIQTAAQTLSTLLLQDFAELLAKRDAAALRAFTLRIGLLLAGAAVVGAGALYLVIGPLLSLLFGSRYLGAIAPFRILLIGAAAASALAWVSPLLTSLRRMRAIVWLNVWTFVVFVVSLAVAAPFAHGLAPAVAVASAMALGHLAGFLSVRRALSEASTG